MASFQTTSEASKTTGAVPFAKELVDPQGGPSALSVKASARQFHSESDRENDDAMVPSFLKAPAPVPQAASTPKTFWDSTPTPRPPPRLAPMPKSPEVRSSPPPLVISTHLNTTSATPVVAPSERLELMGKSRYAAAYHAHNRSHSYSQAHSNHDNNIFALPSDSIPNHHTGGSLASLSATGTEGGLGFNHDSALNGATGLTSAVTRSYSNTTLSHASPAALRTSLPHSQQQQQQQPQLHRHNPQSNPLLTPSSSQSSLFSNLPSPLTRSSLSSASNILRDPSPATQSLSWVSSQAISKPADQVTPDSSTFQDGSSIDASVTDAVAIAPSSLGSGPSSQRKIYPGLKNTVGPYKLIRNIGQGSFSEVKMAVDTRTGEHVAIKVVNRAMIQASDRLGISVRRESDLLKSIQHPNIVGFREVVETSLQMCIVLDYASGGELFEFVADRRSQASEQDIQYIFAQIVEAVDYLHQHNIVHRDLKLENVLLEPRVGAPLRPTVKLTDFGLAKVIEQDGPLLTTRCGSEDYAAPEIILGQPYDGREADIWSLGVVLYALLVGFLPFNMRRGMGRKSFLTMIAQAEFGFPGERVSFKRASLLSIRQRSMSSASTASTTSTLASPTPVGDHPSGGGALLPSVTLDTSLSALSTSPSAETGSTTIIVPKMQGVNPVSDQAKELVRWLLQTQGSKRPTTRQLMEHPWVVAGRQAVAESKST
ncbi:kinase-like domain-containing protein [Mortierella sp. GBAus27b]|nr:Serine/threonine-protein kinase brsk1 [Mortierella sp. GBA43]KAI8347399.1 kinase-like domain-containing protein [Mortierella sp. GBAus27b]